MHRWHCKSSNTYAYISISSHLINKKTNNYRREKIGARAKSIANNLEDILVYYWDALVFFTLIFIVFTGTIRACFFTVEMWYWVWLIDIVCDIIYFADLIINFFVDRNHKILSEKYKTTKAQRLRQRHLKYLKSWFLVDLVAILPIQIFGYFYTHLYAWLRLIRLVKLLKLYFYYSIFENSFSRLEAPLLFFFNFFFLFIFV